MRNVPPRRWRVIRDEPGRAPHDSVAEPSPGTDHTVAVRRDKAGAAHPQAASPRAVAVVLSLLVAAGWSALAIDLAVGRWAAAGGCPRRVHEMLHVTESFGNGWGIAVVLGAVWFLDPLRRRAVPRLALASLGAGLAANAFKLLVSRVRPRSLPERTLDVFQTFWGWLPESHARSTGHSFPSAHTASAVALAVMLATLYPRGRWYFAVLAACVAVQRIEIAAHFPSDVCWGAAIGWGMGQLLARGRWLTRVDGQAYSAPAPRLDEPARQAA